MRYITIETDENQKETSPHGSVEFPMEIHHDHLYEFSDRYIGCHWHDELEIPVVVQGKIRYRLQDKSIDLQEGEGIVINSRIPHSAAPVGQEEPVLLTVIFHPAFLYGTPSNAIYQKLIRPYLSSPGLSGILLDRLQVQRMGQIDSLYQSASFGFELEIQSLLTHLFYELLSCRQSFLEERPKQGEESLSRLQLLLDAIHQNYASPLSLSELAARICVSRESCCRFFKKMTGKTIFQYLEDYRVSQGALLLQDDRYSITQIAYQVGFGNPGRFAAAFAGRMGCTPRQYRQKLSQRKG